MTSDYHLSASIALKSFLENPLLKKYNIQVKGIISAATFHPLDKRSLRMSWKFLQRSGLKFFLKSVATNIWQSLSMGFAKTFIPNSKREFFAAEELAEMYGIPFKAVRNINGKTSERFLKSKKPDYLVSILLLQIVKKNILDIPTKNSINFHPALTQEHRGSFTAFWALMKNWRRSGSTVHFMTEKVDDGKIIIQKRFFIQPSDTLHCVNKKSAELGGALLAQALVKLKKKKTKGFSLKRLGNLFTMPTEKEVEEFHKQGKHTIHWKDVFHF